MMELLKLYLLEQTTTMQTYIPRIHQKKFSKDMLINIWLMLDRSIEAIGRMLK
jgi:hypothetical protein